MAYFTQPPHVETIQETAAIVNECTHSDSSAESSRLWYVRNVAAIAEDLLWWTLALSYILIKIPATKTPPSALRERCS